MSNNVEKYDQYFTSNKTLQRKVYNFILKNPKRILEPCFGRGDLVKYVLKKSDVIFDLYEIDKNIDILPNIDNERINIKYCDFLKKKIDKKYKTIIGNPPFKWCLDFVDKCYELLMNGGELIFIIPSNFFKLTSSSTLLNKMMQNGKITHIYHPNNEHLFSSASIDIMVFRYCKFHKNHENMNNEQYEINYNDESMYCNNNNGLITFTKHPINTNKQFKEYFDIYVGMVSGCEQIFKITNDYDKFGKSIEQYTINILNKENRIDKYILINEFPTKNKKLNNYMIDNKEKLINRKIRNFNENNWFEWGALRNIKNVKARLNENCIYIETLTRCDKVAFIDKVQYFGGGLLILIPKLDTNLKKNELQQITKFINNELHESFIYSGRFKIGHRQISNSYFNISNSC